MSVESVKLTVAFVANMPDDELDADTKADEIEDVIVQAAKAAVVQAPGMTEFVAVDSISAGGWHSEPYDG